MAFTVRGTSFAESVGNLTCNVPAGTANGDIMFLIYHRQNAADYSVDASWNALADTLITGTYNFHIFWKIASSEPASYGLTSAQGARSTGWIMSGYGDFDPADPIDAVSNTQYTTSNSTVRVASFNVASANSILLTFALESTATNPTTFSPATSPGTFTEDYDGGGATGRGWLEVAHLIWTGSGATGDIDITSSFATGVYKHGFGVSLNPPAASGPANLKSRSGNLKANIKSISGNVIANIKSLSGNS